jgi:DUF971 family protein
MPGMPVPRKVEPDAAARELRIVWSDGHRTSIPFQRLRDFCPCARCRTERGKGRRPLQMVLTTKLLEWKKIGNYALHFSWGDSHSEGIFAYDYLRRLCPCPLCLADAPTE